MANSDNVLRGGLTPKHVDVPELLRVLDFTPANEAALRPTTSQDGMETVYETLAPEFAVSVLGLDGETSRPRGRRTARHDGPQILLCTEGSAVVHAKSSVVTLQRGGAAWVAADDGPIRLVAQQSDQAVPRDRGASDRMSTRQHKGDPGGPARPTRASRWRSSSAF